MRFYIKQKIFSFKDKFDITDEQQNPQFKVEGKFMSISNKLNLMNNQGETVLHAQRKVFSLLPKYFIYDPQGSEVAQIQRKFGFKPKFDVLEGHNELKVAGSFFGHSFDVFEGDTIVASIQKRILTWGDTYEIDIDDNKNPALYLFIVIIIDQVIHEQKRTKISFNT